MMKNKIFFKNVSIMNYNDEEKIYEIKEDIYNIFDNSSIIILNDYLNTVYIKNYDNNWYSKLSNNRYKLEEIYFIIKCGKYIAEIYNKNKMKIKTIVWNEL